VKTTIGQVGQSVGQEVTIGAWLGNKRSSGKIAFLQLRDGSGLVDSYFFPIEIVTVPTIREEDGLAKSSRNVYLTDQEREEAPKLYQALLAAKEQFDLENLDNILEEITELVKRQTSGTLDYVQALTYPELKQVTNQKDSIIIAIAVQFKHVRLIDNVLFKLKEETRCIEQ